MDKDKNWKKLIVERPRAGGTRRDASKRDRSKDQRHEQVGDWDALPKQERLYSEGRLNDRAGESKHFTDHLNPLLRWLRKQVGRPWSKVFSELRDMVDNTSTTGRHVYQHLQSWIDTNVVIYEDGEVWAHGRVGPTKLGSYSHRAPDFYVNPNTGLLCMAPVQVASWRRRDESYAKALRERRLEKNGRVFEKHDGIWYEFLPRDVQRSKEVYGTVYDPPKPEEGRFATYRRSRQVLIRTEHYVEQVWDVKRQLSSKELQALGLVNDNREGRKPPKRKETVDEMLRRIRDR